MPEELSMWEQWNKWSSCIFTTTNAWTAPIVMLWNKLYLCIYTTTNAWTALIVMLWNKQSWCIYTTINAWTALIVMLWNKQSVCIYTTSNAWTALIVMLWNSLDVSIQQAIIITDWKSTVTVQLPISPFSKCLTHLCPVDSPILRNWVYLFPKLGMSSIYSIYSLYIY